MALNQDLSLDGLPKEVAERVLSGIRNPTVKQLSPGAKLYRFASSKYPPASWPAGPWWVQQQAFHRIVQEAAQQPAEFGLGWAARRALAIQQGFSTVDAVVEATVAETIYVFCGRGTKQYREQAPNGIYVTWEGWPDIEQLFIPNISDGGKLTPAGQRVLNIYRWCLITSYQWF